MSLDAAPRVVDWIRARDGGVEISTGKVDIGQRISTALVRIAAEELCLSSEAITVAPVRTGAAPDEGITSGSNSIEQSGRALRLAAATARRAALVLAAEVLETAPDTLRIVDGIVQDPARNRTRTVAELIAELDPSLDVDVAAPLLAPADRVTPELAPRGLSEMVRGTHVFVHDLERPGMLHARVVRPPHAHARLAGLDAARVEKLGDEGIEVIRDGSFLAVAGPQEWPVIRAAARLSAAAEWDSGQGLPEDDVFDTLRTADAVRLPVVDGRPQREELPPPLDNTDWRAEFRRPYQMHGALAPSAALAEWRDGRLEILSHSQGIYPLRQSIAESLGLDLAAVEIAHVPGSGCYGHNGADDAAFEAALVAQALPDRPVLLKWSREDEHGWEPVAPAAVVGVAVRRDGDGRVAAFGMEARSDTHRGRPRPGEDLAGPRRLLANRLRAEALEPGPTVPNMGKHAGIHRNLDPVYAFPERRLVKALVPGGPLRTSAMRCLGAVVNVFAIESAMDMLAAEAGAEPIAYRRAQIDDPRAIAVLDRLAEGLGPDVEGRGIAYAQYKNVMARVGVAVDLDVTDAAEVALKRIRLVADAGRVVDPDGLRAQLEGGALQGASWALCEAVRWDRDGVQSRDWESYPVLRFGNVPEFEIEVLDYPEETSLGAGEAAPPPTVAAIANAIAAATGLRLTEMPFTPDALTAAALAE